LNERQPDSSDLISIERDRLQALVERDMDRAAELHADDFELVTPSGRTLSKAEYLEGVRTHDIDYWRWEAGEIAVRVQGDMAVIRYPAEMTFRDADGPRYRTVHTDLYERRDGRWQVVWSQATVVRD
jgi:ketosteroid isomerase-like protein